MNLRTKRMSIVFLVLFMSSAIPGTSFAKWRELDTEDGVQVYRRRVAGSGSEAFRAVTRVKATIDTLLAVFDHPAAAPKWVYKCAEHKSLDYVSFDERYTYQTYDMPWPVKDRDVVLHITVKPLSGEGNFQMRMEGVADYISKKPGYVRIPKLVSVHDFRTAGDGYVDVTWTQHVELGGNLPDWVSNSHVVDMPLKSFEKLRKLIKKPRYRDAVLVYNQELPVGFK